MISLIEIPKLKIAIISLSLSYFINAIINPNIITNGIMIFIRFGIKNIDR